MTMPVGTKKVEAKKAPKGLWVGPGRINSDATKRYPLGVYLGDKNCDNDGNRLPTAEVITKIHGNHDEGDGDSPVKLGAVILRAESQGQRFLTAIEKEVIQKRWGLLEIPVGHIDGVIMLLKEAKARLAKEKPVGKAEGTSIDRCLLICKDMTPKTFGRPKKTKPAGTKRSKSARKEKEYDWAKHK